MLVFTNLTVLRAGSGTFVSSLRVMLRGRLPPFMLSGNVDASILSETDQTRIEAHREMQVQHHITDHPFQRFIQRNSDAKPRKATAIPGQCSEPVRRNCPLSFTFPYQRTERPTLGYESRLPPTTWQLWKGRTWDPVAEEIRTFR